MAAEVVTLTLTYRDILRLAHEQLAAGGDVTAEFVYGCLIIAELDDLELDRLGRTLQQMRRRHFRRLGLTVPQLDESPVR